MIQNKSARLLLGLARAVPLLAAALLVGHPIGAAPAPQVGGTATATPRPANATPTAPFFIASPTLTTRPPTTFPFQPGTPTRTPTPRSAPRTPTPRPYTGVPHGTPVPIIFASPAITSLTGIWLGEITQAANIRRGPGLAYAVDRTWPHGRRVLVYATVIAANNELWYQVGHYPDPVLYVHSSLVTYVAALESPAPGPRGRWIDVDLTQQTLIAFQDNTPVLVAQISSGKPGHETNVGNWRIYWRLPKQDMDGGGESPTSPYYNLKDVPWVQYFYQSGEALHGTYWHDNFGRPMSHGCVNLSNQNANWLYLWANVGTLVHVHYSASPSTPNVAPGTGRPGP